MTVAAESVRRLRLHNRTPLSSRPVTLQNKHTCKYTTHYNPNTVEPL